jgi:hypothetical protein
MLCCQKCLGPLTNDYCAVCGQESTLKLSALAKPGYFSLQNENSIAVALQKPFTSSWTLLGCLNPPKKTIPLTHPKWSQLCIFDASDTLTRQKENSPFTEQDLWHLSQRGLELLIQLKQHGFCHGGLSLDTVCWYRPHLFFLGFRPINQTLVGEENDLRELKNILFILSERIKGSKSLNRFVRNLDTHKTAHEALLVLHNAHMSIIQKNNDVDDFPDPLLHESLNDHIIRARHRSWWQPAPKDNSIHPVHLFVGMIFTICTGTALILFLWQYIKDVLT